MWYIGTRFKGALDEDPSEVCMINWINGDELGYIIVPKSQQYPHKFNKPSVPTAVSFCTGCVKRGNWIILSQPFEAYYKQVLKLKSHE